MTLSIKEPARQAPSAPLLTIITLATWRLRQSWLFLSVTGLGMIAAVVIVCTIPIFSQISTTVGVRGVLNAIPESSYIVLSTGSSVITPSSVQEIEQHLMPPMQKNLGEYMSEAPELTLSSQKMDLIAPNSQGGTGIYNSMVLYGANIAHAGSHATLIKGRLPSDSNLEIAITSSTAAALNVDVGAQITLQYKMMSYDPSSFVVSFATPLLKLRVVGIFKPASGKDVFWHENTFEEERQGTFFLFKGLVSNDALIQAFAQSQKPHMFFQLPVDLYWFYHLDPLRISSTQLNDIISKIAALQVLISNQQAALSDIMVINVRPPSISGLPVSAYGNTSDLLRYRDRAATIQTPILLLTLQVLLLVLFFLIISADLLVNRQVDAIALLRSRGASRRQIMGALITQSLVLAIIVLFIAPLLTILLVRIIMQHILLPQDQNALNTIS